MKSYADSKRKDKEFEVGDSVYLKLQPYRQNSVELRRNLKLTSRFYGPYKVLARVGAVAYHLALPERSKVHPVFHVSLLKRGLPADTAWRFGTTDFGGCGLYVGKIQEIDPWGQGLETGGGIVEVAVSSPKLGGSSGPSTFGLSEVVSMEMKKSGHENFKKGCLGIGGEELTFGVNYSPHSASGSKSKAEQVLG